ncbi:MAG: hypothetical protein DIU70_009670 [Bacillota bacterium]|nr:MAG: hypothetical protein DIU70_03665 [Bacillota bacterium]
MLSAPGGVPDPRASLRFFTVHALSFALLGLVLPKAAAHAESFRHNPSLLIAVHAFTLGLTALEMGAFYQLVPVVLGQPPADRRPGIRQAWLLGVGIALILVGFRLWQPLVLGAGGTLVLAAVLWFVATVAPGVLRALPQGLIPAYLTGALASLVLVVSLGLTLALNLRFRFLPAGAWPVLGAHLVVGAAGWFGLAIIGLSYRLGAMFYFTPRGEPPAWARWMAWATVGVLALLGLLLAGGYGPRALPVAAALAILGAAYALDFGRRIHRRGRRVTDPTILHLYASVAALLLASAGTLAAALGWRPGPGGWSALGLLLLPGWAGNIAIGLAYKIVPFLVWYHRYAPIAGQGRVPTLAQMLPPLLPRAGVWLWNAGLAGLVAGVLLGSPPGLKSLAGTAAALGVLSYAASALYVLLRR